MRHSSFCITLPVLFSVFHCDHLEWNCYSPLLGLLQDPRFTFRIYSLCVLSPSTSKLVCTLLCCTEELSLLRSALLFSPKQHTSEFCFCNPWLLRNALQPAMLQSFSAITHNPTKATVNCHWFWKYPSELFQFYLSACLKRYSWSRMFAIVYSLSQLLYLWNMCLQGNSFHTACIFSSF